MLLRAVILLFVTSNVWALGTPLQSPVGVPVEQIVGGEVTETICIYGFLDPEAVGDAPDIGTYRENVLFNCGLEEGDGNIQLLSEINEPDQTLPNQGSLVRGVISEEGIDELEEQVVRYSDTEQREVRVIQGDALQIFTANRDEIFVHTFDYESGQGQSYTFPKLINRVDTLSLLVTIGGEEPDNIHVSPYLTDRAGNFNYWQRASNQALNEGYWGVGDSLGLPAGLDGFIDILAHPEYANTSYNIINNGFVLSYSNLDNSGLWLNGHQYDGNNFVEYANQVSPVDISQSKLIKTHRGLAQFYIEGREESELKVAYLRFIEEVATPVLTLESTDEFHSLDSVYSSSGTLYISYFENGSDLIWHSQATDEISYSVIPSTMDRLEGCHADQDRIFCIMSNLSDDHKACNDECEKGLFLFELINGVFVKDRTFDHIMLDQGILSFSGIYAHGKNRFVLVQTIDHKYRLFNLTLSGTLLSKKIDNRNLDIDVSVIPGIAEGVFFLVFAANQSAETIKILANLNLDSQIPDEDSSDGRDLDGAAEENEEEKEIPFAEFSSSLSQYLLFIMILFLLPLGGNRR